MEFPCALELQSLLDEDKHLPQTDTEAPLQERPDPWRDLLLPGRHNSSPETGVKPLIAFPATIKGDCNRNYHQRLLLRGQGLAPERQQVKKPPLRGHHSCTRVTKLQIKPEASRDSDLCSSWVVLTAINQIKSPPLHGAFIGHLTPPANLRARWHLLLLQQQEPTTEHPVNLGRLRADRLCAPVVQDLQQLQQNPDDSLSFIPGRSQDNKWE